MKIQLIKCDRCGVTISGNPIRIFVNDIDRNTEEIIKENHISEEINLTEQDFCEECIRKMFEPVPEWIEAYTQYPDQDEMTPEEPEEPEELEEAAGAEKSGG